MNPTVWLALIAIIPTTLASILGFLTLMQSKQNTQLAAENNNKTDQVVKKTDEIHILTNSNLTTVTNALQVANEKISGLEKLVTQLMVDAKVVVKDKK